MRGIAGVDDVRVDLWDVVDVEMELGQRRWQEAGQEDVGGVRQPCRTSIRDTQLPVLFSCTAYASAREAWHCRSATSPSDRAEASGSSTYDHRGDRAGLPLPPGPEAPNRPLTPRGRARISLAVLILVGDRSAAQE